MQTTSDIRSHFFEYFKRHDHTIVPSSSLVPQNDPTLMFTNAGMNQFKDVFTGRETREYVKAASSQKCVRAGGKHNDLENVGHTARHHTFFEMLGNFSFGDYFKETAIELAWKLVTNEFGLDVERLLVTVYAEDEEAAKLWTKISGLPDHKIIKISTSDNFWAMGDTGPCGPCSEIFYDHGSEIPGGPPGSPNEDGDRFVEIWNLVFMQYLIAEVDSERILLPKPSIDTGMGLERITAVMQGVHDNYDIDLFKALISASENFIGHPAQTQEEKISHRVIADHLRSSSFLIADGVLPSNEGRGYVLRRIMRRGMRHAHILGSEEPMMWNLVPALVKEMGEAYPELILNEALIKEVLELEELNFKKTLGRGLKLLNQETQKLTDSQNLPGEVAFKLYDTYGFPLDLTQDILKTENRSVDLKGFNKAMDQQKAKARAAWTGSGDHKQETIWYDLHEKHGATDFLGYETIHAEGIILSLVKNGIELKEAKQGDEIQIITNQSPFYAESGGQIGDTGCFKTDDAEAEILDTVRKVKGLHAHLARVKSGIIHTGDSVDMLVDGIRRDQLRANHSATHLLHAALRLHLGDQVIQKGSLVAPDRLRFDFSYSNPLTREQLAIIENEVNHRIRLNAEVKTRLMPPEKAQEKGAMALFGEKYAEEVRVVSMGGEDDRSKNLEKSYSFELCGGTHVRRTGDIGFFKITSEIGIAAGIRRVEALTGQAAVKYAQDQEKILGQVAHDLKSKPDELIVKVELILNEKRQLEKEIKSLQKKLASGSGNQKQEVEIENINGLNFIHREFEEIPAKELKPIVDELKKKIKSGVVMVTSTLDSKVSVVIGVTQDSTNKASAVDLVKSASQVLGGQGGGGRPDMAQAGGTQPHKILEAVDKIRSLLK